MTYPWFHEAETLKAEFLNRLEELSPQGRRSSPGPNNWSAAQVVGHLVRVEELLADDWHAAAEAAPPAVKPGWQGTLLMRAVNSGMRGPFRIPTRPFLEPTGSLELPDLSDRWAAVRERLRGTLPADASALWIIHPILGPLSCRQTGEFLVAHLQHHLKRWPEEKRA